MYFWHKVNYEWFTRFLEWFTLLEDFEDQHGDYGFRVNKKEGRSYVKFCAPTNITIHLLRIGKVVLCWSVPSKKDYFLGRRPQRKFIKECFTKHKPFGFELKVINIKDTKTKFLATRNIWKLKVTFRSDSRSSVKEFKRGCTKDHRQDMWMGK